jgi:methylphosphotriester-DNA--protein-cysteine methyltransferase
VVGSRRWQLVGSDGASYASSEPGTLGGHRRTKIYGRLDCPAALRAIARGGYVASRVFFADAATARAAGYRPCAVCMATQYRRWKRAQRG